MFVFTLVILVLVPFTAVHLIDFFSPMWDSIYDPRSPYQRRKDGK